MLLVAMFALVATSTASRMVESMEHPDDDLLAMPSDSSASAVYRMPGMFGFKVQQNFEFL